MKYKVMLLLAMLCLLVYLSVIAYARPVAATQVECARILYAAPLGITFETFECN